MAPSIKDTRVDWSRLARGLPPRFPLPQPLRESRRSTRVAASNASNFIVAAVQSDEVDEETDASKQREDDEDIESEYAMHQRTSSRKRSNAVSKRRRSSSASVSPEAVVEQSRNRRNPSRIRSTKYCFDPEDYDEPPTKRRRPIRAAAKVEEPESDEGSDEQEDEAAEVDGAGEGAIGVRYSLRDRTRKEARYSPPKEAQRERQRIAQAKAERRFRERIGGGSIRRHHKRPLGGGSTWSDGINGGTGRDWFALPDAAAVAAAAAVSGMHPGGPALPGSVEASLAAGGGTGGLQGGTNRNIEVTPVEIDSSLTFDQIGGLDGHVDKLKEMIFLPLTYPELFECFHISPPRGVLFYGPPGTGKTLVARALAAQASTPGRKVTFFMRKGADILSKWVGEAERVLRMLFAEAERCQPSIIFFDEIDGLAPIRSSKQDQIHNSIVSTLLALMDGLTSRGQVVVIGATNRPDALDAALRRPGRFDRELLFPLPNVEARDAILRIHTRAWKPEPDKLLRAHLADITAGYCGSDLKALCTEASLVALRRCFPQIYSSDQKLLLDPSAVKVSRQDFETAFRGITPASGRSVASSARLLSPMVAPCLQEQLDNALVAIRGIFPAAAATAARQQQTADGSVAGKGTPMHMAGGVQEARVLLCGPEGAGQCHLGPAVLAALEALPVHSIGLPALTSDANSRSTEEAVVRAVVEARRNAPAVLYLPHLQLWWATASETLRATLWMLLSDLPPSAALLLVATADVPLQDLDSQAVALFKTGSQWVHEVSSPTKMQRARFFRAICTTLAYPPPEVAPVTILVPPELPRAPEAIAATEAATTAAAAAAVQATRASDIAAVRTLRIALREVTTQLLVDRRWRAFSEPVSSLEDPEYANLVSAPMDLAMLLMRIDQRRYGTLAAFMADMQAIPTAATEYWAGDPRGVREVSRAHALVDEACAQLTETLPPEVISRTNIIDSSGGLSEGAAGETDVLLPKLPPLPSKTAKSWKNTTAKTPVARSVPTRETRATRQQAIDPRVIFNDPEAQLRQSRQLRRVMQQAAQSTESRLGDDRRSAPQQHEQWQQQQHERQEKEVDEPQQQNQEEEPQHQRQSQQKQQVQPQDQPKTQKQQHSDQAAPPAADADGATLDLTQLARQAQGSGCPAANGLTSRDTVSGTDFKMDADADDSAALISKPYGAGTNGAMDQLAAQVVAAVEHGINIDDAEAHASAAEATNNSMQPKSINHGLPAPPPEQLESKVPVQTQLDASDIARAEALEAHLVDACCRLQLSTMEDIHNQLSRVAASQSLEKDRDVVVRLAIGAIEPMCQLPERDSINSHVDH